MLVVEIPSGDYEKKMCTSQTLVHLGGHVAELSVESTSPTRSSPIQLGTGYYLVLPFRPMLIASQKPVLGFLLCDVRRMLVVNVLHGCPDGHTDP